MEGSKSILQPALGGAECKSLQEPGYIAETPPARTQRQESSCLHFRIEQIWLSQHQQPHTNQSCNTVCMQQLPAPTCTSGLNGSDSASSMNRRSSSSALRRCSVILRRAACGRSQWGRGKQAVWGGRCRRCCRSSSAVRLCSLNLRETACTHFKCRAKTFIQKKKHPKHWRAPPAALGRPWHVPPPASPWAAAPAAPAASPGTTRREGGWEDRFGTHVLQATQQMCMSVWVKVRRMLACGNQLRSQPPKLKPCSLPGKSPPDQAPILASPSQHPHTPAACLDHQLRIDGRAISVLGHRVASCPLLLRRGLRGRALLCRARCTRWHAAQQHQQIVGLDAGGVQRLPAGLNSARAGAHDGPCASCSTGLG